MNDARRRTSSTPPFCGDANSPLELMTAAGYHRMQVPGAERAAAAELMRRLFATCRGPDCARSGHSPAASTADPPRGGSASCAGDVVVAGRARGRRSLAPRNGGGLSGDRRSLGVTRRGRGGAVIVEPTASRRSWACCERGRIGIAVRRSTSRSDVAARRTCRRVSGAFEIVKPRGTGARRRARCGARSATSTSQAPTCFVVARKARPGRELSRRRW